MFCWHDILLCVIQCLSQIKQTVKNISAETDCKKCNKDCLHKIITKSDFQLINENKIKMHFKPGEEILRQGIFVAQFAYLREGIAKMVIEGKSQKNTILDILCENDFMALSIVGQPNVYPFSVIALTNCSVCYIRKETFIEIQKKNDKLNDFVLRWNANNNIFLFNKLHIFNTRNSHGKLAYILLNLANRNLAPDIFKYLSRKELAELSSISIESANKIIAQLKNDGIITINEEGIKIERLDLIERLSTVG